MISRDPLEPLVTAWLPNQRWFAGKGRQYTIEVAPLTQLSDTVEIWAATVRYSAVDSELYQLPLLARNEPDARLKRVLVGTLDDENGTQWIYDALHDEQASRVWLESIREERTAHGLHFSRYTDAGAIPVDTAGRVLTGEQSNTSIMFGTAAIMKVFRRLQPGINPDIEIGVALGDHGARNVPRLLGAVTVEHDGETFALAMLQEFMSGAQDGWELAKTSVQAALTSATAADSDVEAGGVDSPDFSAEAHALGVAVAEVHADLADAFGVFEPGALRQRADSMNARLTAAINVVPELEPLADGLRAIYEAFAGAASEVVLQRIHGDLHLGQVLRTPQGWVVIDFEGEPMAAIDERRLPDSALRDVAGMLRSFEYAGHHRIVDRHIVDGGHQPELADRADGWTQRNRAAFLDGYTHAAGHDPRAHAVPLHAFEADKAVYEAVYEARNRPAWLGIPLASLTRLAKAEEQS